MEEKKQEVFDKVNTDFTVTLAPVHGKIRVLIDDIIFFATEAKEKGANFLVADIGKSFTSEKFLSADFVAFNIRKESDEEFHNRLLHEKEIEKEKEKIEHKEYLRLKKKFEKKRTHGNT